MKVLGKISKCDLVNYPEFTPRIITSDCCGGVELWSDSNWGGEHKRSTSGHVIKHNGNPISWRAKRQTVVALSTCAAEYIALSEGTQVLAQLNNLLIDLEIPKTLEIYCDNEAAILIAGDNASKKKTHQLADIFTKRLGPNEIEEAIPRINLKKRVMLPHVRGGVTMVM
ncbi:hypothetical protein PCANC_14421 [Puccinia coronata f. sp. avenae]|uniref:Uncharacterized protein n=1 Tax=Puccinia coronata f. sp. avenae TaxID=200324 RepID=A0A2N5SHH3_9BASI|nr:hypothetical protein PCANC_14421 [Puccinia coronata f. sp. avenae]